MFVILDTDLADEFMGADPLSFTSLYIDMVRHFDTHVFLLLINDHNLYRSICLLSYFFMFCKFIVIKNWRIQHYLTSIISQR